MRDRVPITLHGILLKPAAPPAPDPEPTWPNSWTWQRRADREQTSTTGATAIRNLEDAWLRLGALMGSFPLMIHKTSASCGG